MQNVTKLLKKVYDDMAELKAFFKESMEEEFEIQAAKFGAAKGSHQMHAYWNAPVSSYFCCAQLL